MDTLILDLLLALGLLFLVLNSLLDVVYPLLDPRLRQDAIQEERLERATPSERLTETIDTLKDVARGLRLRLRLPAWKRQASRPRRPTPSGCHRRRSTRARAWHRSTVARAKPCRIQPRVPAGVPAPGGHAGACRVGWIVVAGQRLRDPQHHHDRGRAGLPALRSFVQLTPGARMRSAATSRPWCWRVRVGRCRWRSSPRWRGCSWGRRWA